MRLGMILMFAFAFAAASGSGCDKGEKQAARAPTPTTSPGTDGVRRVPVEAGPSGYEPDKVVANAGEKLILVFTRTTEARCLAQVRVADGPITELPVGKPVEIAVTAPDKGATLRFACGMDMMTGVIAVN